MQSLFSSFRQKQSYLIRSLIKSNKLNVDYRYYVADGRKALQSTHVAITTDVDGFPRIRHFNPYKNKTASDFDMYNLLQTVLMRNAFLVRKLIKSNNVDNLDINRQFFHHSNGTLLHVAASDGSLEIVKILVEEGHANINMTDDLDEVPMHCAANNDHIDIVRYLAEKGSKYKEDVELLLKPTEKKFCIVNVDYSHFVADGTKALPAMHVSVLCTKTIELLKDIKLTASDLEMDTLLETVLMRNAFLVGKLIKSKNVDINQKFYYHLDGTFLHVAAKLGSLDIVKILVEEGRADINIRDDLDEVPMHTAATNYHIDIVRYLAEKGSIETELVEYLLKPTEKAFSGNVYIDDFVSF